MTAVKEYVSVVILSLALLAAGALGWSKLENSFKTVTTASVPVSNSVYQDEHLLALSKELGLKHLDGVTLKYVDGFNDSEHRGEYTTTGEGRDKVMTLSLKRGLDSEEERRSLAHEYLHHIWYENDYDANEAFGSKLIAAYSDDEALQDRMNYYSDNNTLKPTEIFSVYCTESSDEYTPSAILDECKKYIDRSKLTMLR